MTKQQVLVQKGSKQVLESDLKWCLLGILKYNNLVKTSLLKTNPIHCTQYNLRLGFFVIICYIFHKDKFYSLSSTYSKLTILVWEMIQWNLSQIDIVRVTRMLIMYNLRLHIFSLKEQLFVFNIPVSSCAYLWAQDPLCLLHNMAYTISTTLHHLNTLFDICLLW